MQLQQLHFEIKKLRRELEKQYEAREDLQDELKEMTQMYLGIRQERDQYKQHMEVVRKDVDQIDRIVHENVERAVRAKDKVIVELQGKIKLEQEKAKDAEQMRDVYAKSVKQLEERVVNLTKDLDEEREKYHLLQDKILMQGVPNLVADEEFEPLEIENEMTRMKHLNIHDENLLSKINDAQHQFVRKSGQNPLRASTGFNPLAGGLQSALSTNNNFTRGGSPTTLDKTDVPQVNQFYDNKDNNHSTEFDLEEDDATNVRLREDSESTMMFDFNKMRAKRPINGDPIHLNHVELDVRRSANIASIRPNSGSGDSSGGSNNRSKSPGKRLATLFGSSKKNQRVTPY